MFILTNQAASKPGKMSMVLLNLHKLTLDFGDGVLFDEIDLTVKERERIALIGRNGSGKSTLLKIFARELEPDRGEIAVAKGVTFSYLPQEIPTYSQERVADVLFSGSGDGEGEDSSIVSLLNLSPDERMSNLSAGAKRRVLLGKALAADPDILLLDEPTNHMDIDSILLFEKILQGFHKTVIMVSHDRMLVKRFARRIIDLDRGRLGAWDCDYDTYLVRKEFALHAEAEERRKFDKKLAEEEIWIRQGIKARRTRNEGRVKELLNMRQQRGRRRDLTGNVKMEAQEAAISGKLVAEIKSVNFRYQEDKTIVRDFSTTIMRGDRVGIVGNNGAGKSTLLNVILGKLQPDSGVVRLGTNLEIAYYDQLRDALDEEKSVVDNIVMGEGSDTVLINGKCKHIIGYLQDFMFSPVRSRCKVKVLSGGEKNRLLLARLFTLPFNLLVLDEPTNDLDVETLELLEDLLINYKGTLLLVSHDREFLNNVVTSVIAMDGDGNVNEYIGGYSDWEKDKQARLAARTTKEAKSVKKKTGSRPRKLSYKEVRELEELPLNIEALEQEQQEIFRQMGDPDFYKKEKELIASVKERMDTVKAQLEEMYGRWETLEELKAVRESVSIGADA